MPDKAPHQSEPHVLDQPWRMWSSAAVVGILLSGILLGVLIIPVVQGRSVGIFLVNLEKWARGETMQNVFRG